MVSSYCQSFRQVAFALCFGFGVAVLAANGQAESLKNSAEPELRFSYFPSSNRLRLLVTGGGFTQWEAAITNATTGRIAVGQGPMPLGKAGQTLPVPPLPDGTYQLNVTLSGPQSERLALKRRFERHHFAWETNRLGLERVVIPPFAPLTVKEAPPQVGCVLRQHELDGIGLWKQVRSQDVPLLEAPMRLEIQAGGKTYIAQGSAPSFSQKDPDCVRGQARWSAGPVQGRTEFAFDYDGLAQFGLEFGRAGVAIEAMQLVIPLRTQEAWLMHPVTDLLRFHYAGAIPAGKGWVWDSVGKRREVRYTQTGQPEPNGKVWDSRAVERYKLPGPFVPYIWLGGPERGIAWMAENDQDFSLAPDQATLEIRRQGDTTSLIVKLINRPVVLTRTRHLHFGLMATPAKPMPERPVSFRRWWTGPPSQAASNVVGLGFMGATYYWGGVSFSFYPAFKNFSIWDEFSRLRAGGAVDPRFTDQWLAQFSSPEFQPHLKLYRAHVDWTVCFFSDGHWASQPGRGRTAYVSPYTNARGLNWGEEARTFLDEWSTIDIADPRWPGEERFLRTPEGGYQAVGYSEFGQLGQPGETSGIGYAVDPVASWQDMALYYCKRLLDTFADGIYFDDYFLSANYNPLGPGYVDDEGNLRPGVNLYAFHALTKRLAVMQHQAGRRPLVFLHMSNANIVPMLSFGTMLLDHEWRDQGEYRDQDFHERLGLDEDTSLLLAQSTGLQSGCLGIVHNLFHGDARLMRSALGVALTHEMRMGADGDPVSRSVGDILCHFGYGLPDCRVWRYWDTNQPLRASGVPAKALVLARQGKALLVLTSYGPAGEVTLELDPKALGLSTESTARNAETGEALEPVGPGRFKLSLPRHDFRLVRIDPR